ncbi:50S ribosomal protein L32 [Spongiactinospora rosea]|uniref:Large ribosomal subunit protein bL32 n=1 Tax=Spongiactinospora rosea TaxID=2248750 RepID=A0A366M6N3_9ACTN|nr:50S ribosomal protein L32 [Spongiactinospora rosea]RBQ21901.1 50S ribosomal protein L32 [Spongiactinospora rosea]
MAASGFRRKSRANTRSRRSQWKARPAALTRCPNPACGERTYAHRACTACGQYRGRQVL